MLCSRTLRLKRSCERLRLYFTKGICLQREVGLCHKIKTDVIHLRVQFSCVGGGGRLSLYFSTTSRSSRTVV